MPAPKNLSLIQSFRGIASVLVVLFHVSVNCHSTLNTNFLGGIFAFGRVGVDMFFVLSGFIIAYTSFKDITDTNRLVPFLKRRIIRIYPVYWIIITFFLVSKFGFLSASKNEYDLNFENLISTYLLFPNHEMINGVSWTLSFEMFFYLLFSLTFIIKNKELLIGMLFTYTAFVILLYYNSPHIYDTNAWVAFLLSPRNAEFFAGVLVAFLYKYIPVKMSVLLMITGSLLFIFGAFIDNMGYPVASIMLKRIVVFGISSFILIAGAARFESTTIIKSNAILSSLGDASYSLYLLHLPVIAIAFKIFSLFKVQHPLIVNLYALAVIVFICYGSVLFFRYIEKPLINRLNARKVHQLFEIKPTHL